MTDPSGRATALPGKRSAVSGSRRRHVGVVAGLERALGRVLLDELGDERGETGAVPLAGHRGHDVALRVDDDERRPRAGRVGPPRRELRVVEHGVVDGIPLDGRGERDGIRLVLELRRVHADDRQRVGEARLERVAARRGRGGS